MTGLPWKKRQKPLFSTRFICVLMQNTGGIQIRKANYQYTQTHTCTSVPVREVFFGPFSALCFWWGLQSMRQGTAVRLLPLLGPLVLPSTKRCSRCTSGRVNLPPSQLVRPICTLLAGVLLVKELVLMEHLMRCSCFLKHQGWKRFRQNNRYNFSRGLGYYPLASNLHNWTLN